MQLYKESCPAGSSSDVTGATGIGAPDTATTAADELKLRSQIDSAEAEEKVYSESEVKSSSHGHPPSAAKPTNDDTLPYPRHESSSESMMKMLHEG